MATTVHVEQKLHWDLPDDPVIIRHARDLVRDALTSWNLHNLIDDITLVISELVTNALIHGAPPIRLHLGLTPEALTGRVYGTRVLDDLDVSRSNMTQTMAAVCRSWLPHGRMAVRTGPLRYGEEHLVPSQSGTRTLATKFSVRVRWQKRTRPEGL